MNDLNAINWDRPRLERFKKAMAAAPGDQNAIFIFDSYEFAKSYANYLIEYLDGVLQKEAGK